MLWFAKDGPLNDNIVGKMLQGEENWKTIATTFIEKIVERMKKKENLVDEIRVAIPLQCYSMTIHFLSLILANRQQRRNIEVYNQTF